MTGLHIYDASSASGLLRPFLSQNEQSHPEWSAEMTKAGDAGRRLVEKGIRGIYFRGKGAREFR